MDLIELKERQDIADNIKLSRAYVQLGGLLTALRKRELPDKIVESINQDIEALNAIPIADVELRKWVKKKQSKIIKLIENELKIVPQNYYRNIWMAVGMGFFGLPIGMIFGFNFGYMGLPIGMVIGMALGAEMDKKAAKEGRQLDVEIKY